MRCTYFRGSVALTFGEFNQSWIERWYAAGVCNSPTPWRCAERMLKVWSKSSWLWPDSRVRSSPLRILYVFVSAPSNRHILLFFNSLLELSPNTTTSHWERSRPGTCDKMCRQCATTSQDHELVWWTYGSAKTITVAKPWTRAAVQVKHGLMKLLKSFDPIAKLFGYVYLEWSMLSTVMTIVWLPFDCMPNLDKAREFQYCIRSRYCRSRCNRYNRNCSFFASSKRSNLDSSNLCLIHVEHFLCCDFGRISNSSENPSSQT